MLCNYLIDIYEQHIQPNLIGDELLYSPLLENRLFAKYNEIIRIKKQGNSIKYYDIYDNLVLKLLGNKLLWHMEYFQIVIANDYLYYVTLEELQSHLVNITNKHPLFNNSIYVVNWGILK
jgi:hypothetical protein